MSSRDTHLTILGTCSNTNSCNFFSFNSHSYPGFMKREGMHEIQHKLKGWLFFIKLCLLSCPLFSTLCCLAMFRQLYNSKFWSQLNKTDMFYMLHLSSHTGCGLENSSRQSQINHVAHVIEHCYFTDHGPELSVMPHLKPFILCFPSHSPPVI